MNKKSTWLLAEREKELECMYAVDDILQDKKLPLPVAMNKIVQILPSGFSQPDICRVQVDLYGVQFAPPDFSLSVFLHKAPILMDNKPVGMLEIRYMKKDNENIPSLLSTEIKIVNAVSARISQLALNSQREINLVLDMLQKANPEILTRICQKLQVYVSGLEGHLVNDKFYKKSSPALTYGEVNTPLPKAVVPDSLEYSHTLVARASAFISCSEIRGLINQWIQDERVFSLVKAVGDKNAQVSEILDAVENFTSQAKSLTEQTPTEKWLIAELCHRFLTSDENLIDRVIGNLSIKDFQPIIAKIIGSSQSFGSIGGKGAGLFIAEQILKHISKTEPLLENIKTPKTWYLAADQIDEFLRYNHMEEMNAYKYNSISYIRMTYNDIVTKIKNARLPSHILKMLVILLDDLKDTPIIVRSSSLLEDRSNSAFSGKYKSLYLSNQGTKQERLDALTDAILEVYSSQYNPDSVEYRSQRHLLHFSEKMGILIQEVVGTRIGPYYMPLFAGVAFSENPLCWSPRITRDGGLVRLVMGLGTRAVDRVSDYPVLFSPKNSGFRINQNPQDIKRYALKYIDLINLEKNCFETVEINQFLKKYGNQFPKLHKMVSVYHPEIMENKNSLELSPKKDDMVVTFDGVLSNTNFPDVILKMLTVLKEKISVEVDLEFAHDGKDLYLLQCRSLNRGTSKEPAPIPKHLPEQNTLFIGNKFISNGKIENIRYIVYVDGDGYKKLESRNDLLAVGNAIGQLNLLLPQKKFILMGFGRWGSR
ncbi:MAG: pyruvate, phosphate dikinase, partial [Clostridiales bacterium]|nr:pyruvate, phosphate dikinase [Clostridiales bacterium]